MSNKSKIAWSVIGVVAFLGLLGRLSVQSPQATPQSYQNTVRNAFIVSCAKSGNVTQSQCGCAYDALGTYYGTKDWAVDSNGNDTQVTKDILANGYTKDQVNVVLPCFAGN